MLVLPHRIPKFGSVRPDSSNQVDKTIIVSCAFPHICKVVHKLKITWNMGGVQLPKQMNDEVDYVTLQIDDQSLSVSEIIRKLLPYYELLRTQVAEKYPTTEVVR